MKTILKLYTALSSPTEKVELEPIPDLAGRSEIQLISHLILFKFLFNTSRIAIWFISETFFTHSILE